MKRLILAFLLLWGCSSADDDQAIGDTADTGSPCPFDQDEDAASATNLAFEQDYEGFLCPIGDVDWYKVELPSGSDLLTVKISLDDPVVPVNPTYAIWNSDASAIVVQPAATDAAGPGDPLELTHSLPAGSYYVAVRDRGGDGQDTRHKYIFSATHAADADTNEPNNSAGDATPATGGAASGFISSWGDEDWFELTADQDNMLVQVTLTMEQGGIHPTFSIVDAEGIELFTITNPNGTRGATLLDAVQALDTQGTYYLVVSDDDKTDGDPSIGYSVTIDIFPDPDGNEPNDHPTDAKVVADQDCSSATSTSDAGYLSSNGDVDWYRVNLSNCGAGVIEVTAGFGGVVLADNVELSGRFVVEVGNEPCTEDQECQLLSNNPCTDHLKDCSKKGNDCRVESFCGGAGFCLPSGVCGANLLAEQARATEPGILRFSAPLAGESVIWVAIEDFHNNAYDLYRDYTLDISVFNDPDTRENSTVYTAGAAIFDDSASEHLKHTFPIDIYGCAPWTPPPPDIDTDLDSDVDTGTGVDPATPGCCNSGTWTTGYLAYMHDQDWFTFPHPCPGQDCMVGVHYQYDNGPVEFYIRQFHGNSGWVDNLASVQDSVNPATLNVGDGGMFGGLNASDFCSYAYNGHPGPYSLVIRDTIFAGNGEDEVEGGVWEWSRTQSYSVCVERIDMGCAGSTDETDTDFPCFLWPDGCGLKP